MQLAMPTGLGAVIAVIVLMVVGGLDLKIGAMIAGLAIARLC